MNEAGENCGCHLERAVIPACGNETADSRRLGRAKSEREKRTTFLKTGPEEE